jgi:hypothetical protein
VGLVRTNLSSYAKNAGKIPVELLIYFFSKTEGRMGLVWGLVLWEGKDIRKNSKRMNMVEILVLMYENGKMRPVETIPGMEEGG